MLDEPQVVTAQYPHAVFPSRRSASRQPAEELVQAILCDSGLAARLLRLVNSAYYGSRRRVETVSQAIVLLGQRELRNLITTTVAVDMF